MFCISLSVMPTKSKNASASRDLAISLMVEPRFSPDDLWTGAQFWLQSHELCFPNLVSVFDPKSTFTNPKKRKIRCIQLRNKFMCFCQEKNTPNPWFVRWIDSVTVPFKLRPAVCIENRMIGRRETMQIHIIEPYKSKSYRTEWNCVVGFWLY